MAIPKADKLALEAARKKCPTAGRLTLAAMTGINPNRVRTWLKGQPAGIHPRISGVKAATGAVVAGGSTESPRAAGKVKTIADFRNLYDKSTIVPTKVKSALKSLGGAGWEYEHLFVKMAGVSISDLSMFREQFAEHIVNLKDNKRAWAGRKETAIVLREML